MRKKDLLTAKPLKLTKAIRNAVENDPVKREKAVYGGWVRLTCKYTRFFAADRVQIKGEDVLHIAYWDREGAEKNQIKPDADIYVLKSESKWYVHKDGKWGESRIDNLIPRYGTSSYNDWFRTKTWSCKKDQKIANEYFNTNCQKSIRDALLDYQLGVDKDFKIRKARKIYEQIDSEMNQIGELPKDFEKWIEKKALLRRQYIIYNRQEKRAWCTNCEKSIGIEKIKGKHNDQMKCPHCRNLEVLKSYNKQSGLHNAIWAGIVQQRKDKSGYFMRQFRVKQQFIKESDYKKQIYISDECYRISMTDSFNTDKVYEQTEDKFGTYRWLYEQPYYNYWNYKVHPQEVELYSRNIKALLRETKLKYMPAADMLKSVEGLEVGILFLFKLGRIPQIEYLWKAGLHRLCWNILSGDSDLKTDKDAKNPVDYLRLNKETFKQAIRVDATRSMVAQLQAAVETKRTMPDEELRFFSQTMDKATALTLFEYTTPQKLMKYAITELKIKKDDETNSYRRLRSFGDYMDYIDDLNFLKMDIKDNMYPKDFKTMHANVAVRRRDKEDEKRKKAIQRDNRKLRKLLPELQKTFKGETKDLMIVWPTCKSDFNREGEMNHNCVGGSYFSNMAAGRCIVVFVRKKTAPDKAYCTVEFAPNGKIRQNRTYGNREAPEDAREFIEEVSKRAQELIFEKEEAKTLAADTKKDRVKVPAV